jgi:hypothetical protein
MTSSERREARYQRRKLKRCEKRKSSIESYDSLEAVADINSLIRASQKARSGVMWKASVQRYLMNLLKNVTESNKNILSGKDIRKGFINFDIVERGKLRHISSVHFSERVVQRSLCANALLPVLTRGLIYDNGASMKGKGISFAVNRLKTHLYRHYRKYGNEGYVLTIDFSNYFGSMRHEPIREILNKSFKDKRLVDFTMLFVDAFGDVGMGLGSETSQIFAIAYPNSVDHCIKERLRIKGYGRYMDDMYLLHKSKARLRECLEVIRTECAKLGIRLNAKKTHITKLSKGFTFLKSQFFLTCTGRVILKAGRESIVRQRRKLKKFRKFMDEGLMTYGQIYNSYMSWRGYIGHKNAYRTIQNMDSLFSTLFLRRSCNGQRTD